MPDSFFATALKAARHAARLTRDQVARHLRVTPDLVSVWEEGYALPAPSLLPSLETLLPPTTDHPSLFGSWLVDTRNHMGFSREQLSRLAGISPATIYNLESGRTLRPRTETRERLAHAAQAGTSHGILYDGIQIRSDEPTATDSLDRAKLAHALVRVVDAAETPFVLGIYGSWGMGKTSLMHQMRNHLEAGQHTRTIWFDPWRHQFDENPALALLHTMVAQLEMGSEARRLLTVIGAAFGSLFLKATTGLSLDDVGKLGERYEEERFLLREKRVRLQEYFADLIAKALTGDVRRLVFFIDDLDRCGPEHVLQVLEALKLYLNVSGCVYVLGVDRRAVQSSIRHRYKDLDLSEVDYLDKIVQLPFSIPPIAASAMRGYVAALLPPPLHSCIGLLVRGLGDNPRQVKRFINTLNLNHELAFELPIRHYSVEVLASILMIQYRTPDLYRMLIQRPRILGERRQDETVAHEIEEAIRGDARVSSIVDSVALAETDLGPYLYLTEVAGTLSQGELVLADIGDKKIQVIKAVRDVTGLGLKDAKDLVDTVPSVVLSGASPEEIKRVAGVFQDLGARVLIS